MWGSSSKRNMTKKVDTLVSEGTRIEGDVTFHGGLHVDGTVNGNITSDGADATAMLVVGAHGCVEGEVSVPNVIISGIVTGDVRAQESVELGPHAQVTGNIYYTRIEVAMGAQVNGQMIHATQGNGRALPAPADHEESSQVARRIEKLHVIDR